MTRVKNAMWDRIGSDQVICALLKWDFVVLQSSPNMEFKFISILKYYNEPYPLCIGKSFTLDRGVNSLLLDALIETCKK